MRVTDGVVDDVQHQYNYVVDMAESEEAEKNILLDQIFLVIRKKWKYIGCQYYKICINLHAFRHLFNVNLPTHNKMIVVSDSNSFITYFYFAFYFSIQRFN